MSIKKLTSTSDPFKSRKPIKFKEEVCSPGTTLSNELLLDEFIEASDLEDYPAPVLGVSHRAFRNIWESLKLAKNKYEVKHIFDSEQAKYHKVLRIYALIYPGIILVPLGDISNDATTVLRLKLKDVECLK